ncbi:MAG: sporulation protein YunB [Clostridia bacterium]|nr:sporulation protein YunB [Clostridia bacterium]
MGKRKRKALICLVLVLLAAGGMLWYVNASIRPVLEGLASARVESASARAMNEAILEVLSTDAAGELLSAQASQEGHISLLTADAGKLNLLAADAAAAAQRRIQDLGEQGVSVALGTLSGIPLLSGLGPRLSFRFTPVGMVQSSFHSEFRSAGINQTLHRITLQLTGTVRLVLPGRSYTVTVMALAPISENVIVGDVPNAYTNVADRDDLLNLIPGQ